jgi:hypothetical protein
VCCGQKEIEKHWVMTVEFQMSAEFSKECFWEVRNKREYPLTKE